MRAFTESESSADLLNAVIPALMKRLRSSPLTMYSISSQRKMNGLIIAVHFCPCLAETFPLWVPSHFLHLIAFKEKVNNQCKAPVAAEQTTSTDLI